MDPGRVGFSCTVVRLSCSMWLAVRVLFDTGGILLAFGDLLPCLASLLREPTFYEIPVALMSAWEYTSEFIFWG